MKEPRVRLDNMRIASPCSVGWEQMTGDERMRRCDLCELHVYDISRMTRREAESLIANSEGRICARLFRRTDGTVITRDCPVGLRTIRRRVAKTAGAVCAAIMSLCLSVAGQNPQADKNSCASQVKITRKVSDAQAEAGMIALKILDVNGAVVAGADVSMKEMSKKPEGSATRNARHQISTDEGLVEFAGLTKGIYALKVEQPGFMMLVVNNVVVKEKECVIVEVTLTVSEGTQTVGLLMEEPLIKPSLIDTPPGTTIIKRKMIESLPHQK